MYNTGKPHTALGKLTPLEFKKKAVENEDNSASNLPFTTASSLMKKSNNLLKKQSTLFRHCQTENREPKTENH